jgi:hypothetical protein
VAAPSSSTSWASSISTTRPRFRTTLLEFASEQPERLVVDLAEVAFVDSTALGRPDRGADDAREPPGVPTGCAGLETHRALKISGLDQHLGVHDTVEAALRGHPG